MDGLSNIQFTILTLHSVHPYFCNLNKQLLSLLVSNFHLFFFSKNSILFNILYDDGFKKFNVEIDSILHLFLLQHRSIVTSNEY